LTETQPIRLLIADDHLILRYGLVAFIDQQPDMRVVGEASNGQEVVDLFRQHKPDVTLMDLRMPGTSGVEAIVAIRKIDPSARVIVLTIHKGDEAAYQALQAGARGYLLKDTPASEIVAAIREVAAGGTYLAAGLSGAAVKGYLGRAQPSRGGLSPRERQVLQLIAEGKKTREIARLLGVSVKTAESHRGHIMAKLEIRDTAGLVRYAIRSGVSEL